MKKVILCTFSFCVFAVSLTNAQSEKKQKTTDAYKAEADRYFVHPANTALGVIVTDNFASAIYLIQNGELKTLVNSPGCGRYFTVSSDQTKIGFKLINADGTQVPAMYDLVTGSIIQLSVPVKLCGQPSFANSGKVTFTIGNELYVLDGGSIQTFDLGVYCNIAPVSPDGNYVIYNDDNDRLFIMNLVNGKTEKITDNKCGYAFPQWSPDGNKVVYSTLAGNIMIRNKITGEIYSIGAGENVSWSDNSQYIIFNRTTVENFEYKGSDIFTAAFNGSEIINITNTEDVNETAPCFSKDNKIIYSIFGKKEIVTSSVDPQLKNKNTLLDYTGVALPYNTTNSAKLSGANNINSIVMVPGSVPYVNQVYDTPSWHSGYSSCAPTTSIMALAYYNKIPKWPTVINHGKSWDPHTNNYGSYIADEYRYNGVYNNLTASDYAGNTSWGGYGFMWNGSGSPNSTMATYLQNHNITSVHSGTTVFSDFQTEINNGYPFPLCNTLTTAGHVTLAVGYVNAQHTLIFNDPYGDKNTGTWPNYTGQNSYYDWPGYNNGYQNLNTMAWTVTAESTHLTYNDTIVDDINYDNGFYIYNQPVSHMKYFHDTETGGYGLYSHYWWTYTSASTSVDTCYVVWTPTLTTSGNYDVSVYIPASNATATAARYKVSYNGGSQTVLVDQSAYSAQWVSLGTFPFLAGSTGNVRLGDAAGFQTQKIAFDAVKWSQANVTTGINKPIAANDVNIYPNPSNGTFVIDAQNNLFNAHCILYDINGKAVLSQILNGKTTIDAGSLSEGVYNLSIKSSGGSVINKRLVIVK